MREFPALPAAERDGLFLTTVLHNKLITEISFRVPPGCNGYGPNAATWQCDRDSTSCVWGVEDVKSKKRKISVQRKTKREREQARESPQPSGNSSVFP